MLPREQRRYRNASPDGGVLYGITSKGDRMKPTATATTRSEREEPAEGRMIPAATLLAPGAPAPDFALPSTGNNAIGPLDFRGKPLILVFYPADWSPVCTDQLALYQEISPEFERLGADLVGISVDGAWCHLAFAKDRNLRFPLLADFEPKGEVSRAYGAYRQADGTSERALFVLDPNGIVSWSYVSPTGINPGADGILRALENLAMKEGAR
jgi:peroxiredoxin